MALYHKWDVKNDFAYVLQFFSLISDSLVSVKGAKSQRVGIPYDPIFIKMNEIIVHQLVSCKQKR